MVIQAPAVGTKVEGPSFSMAALTASPSFKKVAHPVIGITGLMALWWLGGYLIAANPDTESFADFGPITALDALWRILSSGEVWEMSIPSLGRIGGGLFWAIAIGVPMGIIIGRKPTVRGITHVPFQFLRMISPLSWMPVAVLVFATWDGAIVFLIAMAAVWPVTFATANGLRKVDPAWFKVARNLGAKGHQMLLHVILPAIAMDVLTGIRLALGVAWIVLVPAEYLGVTSGLGYSINDARDTLEYDRLAAIVVIIGIIGFALDSICLWLIKRTSWMRES
ncbi:ABC transporter permease [Magnetospira sp. QH-2]|uniref:ABC transporter permease n=1 Tax=Magnetospira sp. (strain QH-2) TaxID=1288970 RepID=UPI0003E80A36|nr:ABC transporter permease [Magnetospira sp. QH-2]CCQ74959.1 putative binding-protein-dependent transport systems inner membrane component [Magnetospira sp. QH-2]